MKKGDIIQAIENIKSVTSVNSSDITGLDAYLFFIGGRLAAFGDGVAISVPLDVGFDAAVAGAEFASFIKKVP